MPARGFTQPKALWVGELAAQQVRDARLGHPKKLGGLRLAHCGTGEMVLERRD